MAEAHARLRFSHQVEVLDVEDIRVTMKGLGQPLNWIVRKILAKFLQRHLREVLEREAKPIIQQELNNVTEADLIALPLGLTSISSMIPQHIPGVIPHT